jgi:rhodanese-related sulfurtransferase
VTTGFKIVLVLAVVLLVAYLSFSRSSGADAEARQLVANGARLVDVRTPQEFASAHLPGAVNIPVQELDRRMAELGPKDEPIVLYCRSGSRSAYAARMLHGAGYSAVYDLGAMNAW